MRLRIEREEAVAKGELVPYDEIHRQFADIYSRVKNHANALMARIPAALGIPAEERAEAADKLAALERDFLEAIASKEDGENAG